MATPYINAVKGMLHAKKGLLLGGDNDPYYADVNAILKGLPETNALSLLGNYYGDKVLQEQAEVATEPNGRYIESSAGFRKHLICAELESMYEGITISTRDQPASTARSSRARTTASSAHATTKTSAEL